jgi:hypothetical protein
MDYQIVRFSFPFENTDYPRPCVVVYSSPQSLGLLAISTKLYANQQPFVISKTHPNFSETGLQDTSYVYGAPVADAAPAKVIGSIGVITGELAREFEKWIG